MAKAKPKSNEFPSEYPIHYIKCDGFRISHADGALLGVTQSQLVCVNFWLARPTIPQFQVFDVSSEGRIDLASPKESHGKDGAIRQVETGVMLTPRMAKIIGKLMIETAEKAERVANETAERVKAGTAKQISKGRKATRATKSTGNAK